MPIVIENKYTILLHEKAHVLIKLKFLVTDKYLQK